MQAAKLILLLLSLTFSFGAYASTATLGEQSSPPTLTAEQIAAALRPLHAPARSEVTPVGGSCATSCGSGPEGSCTKSCKGSQSCSASCAGGKAICSCD